MVALLRRLGGPQRRPAPEGPGLRGAPRAPDGRNRIAGRGPPAAPGGVLAPVVPPPALLGKLPDDEVAAQAGRSVEGCASSGPGCASPPQTDRPGTHPE